MEDNTLYASVCRVRNTFIELIPIVPPLARCKSEPTDFKCASLVAPGSLTSVDLAMPSNRPSEEAEGQTLAQRTCVIVRDLPCKVGSERMTAELDLLGFRGCYDSVVFPKKGRKDRASFVGYGFIYFKTEDYASEFMVIFANHQFKDMKSEKVSYAELARVGGEQVPCRSSTKRKARRAARDIAWRDTAW
eukprot:TRINITY_DN13652_c0_g1_i1.p2 TRINITY_DN13652_c0_g1~~TRINITY_DN13652_c0_g1_i1.p2  ORF type:complete len:208 (+),score=38.26 TRINITY_DN13652_c0_g1_i1:55-624(+)